MKFKSSELRKHAVLACLLGLSSAVAQGGVSPTTANAGQDKVVAAAERQRPAGEQEPPRAYGGGSAEAADAVFKCWQHGRLIFEERDWQASAPDLPGPLLLSGKGDYGKLQLMSFGDTFCFLKHGAR